MQIPDWLYVVFGAVRLMAHKAPITLGLWLFLPICLVMLAIFLPRCALRKRCENLLGPISIYSIIAAVGVLLLSHLIVWNCVVVKEVRILNKLSEKYISSDLNTHHALWVASRDVDFNISVGGVVLTCGLILGIIFAVLAFIAAYHRPQKGKPASSDGSR